MAFFAILAKSDCCTSDCRGGWIWNPQGGPFLCPICKGNNGAVLALGSK
ncbi:hypothetical protein [Nonomuraea longicatena]|uniref:Uncharacterized protein n=1 Tax=Nonomuraea longicatena TaxID=83682 RepID=A0ABP4BHN7_9ACTN